MWLTDDTLVGCKVYRNKELSSSIGIILKMHDCESTRAVHKETELFFYLLFYLQLNQTCLLQRTPLHSLSTAPNVFSSSGTCFAGWRVGPASNFLLSPLPSEIGDLLRISTSGTRKSPQGSNLESGVAGGQSRLVLRQKFTDKEWRVSRCIVMVQHPGVVSPRLRPLPSYCRRQTPQDVSVELFIDCLTTWNILTNHSNHFLNAIVVHWRGRPDLGSSSMDVLPDLKRWYHSWHCVRLKQSSP